MRRNWALGAAALLLVGLAGCGSDSAEQAGDPASGGQGVGTSKTPTGSFVSTEVTEGGKPKKLVKGTLISLLFRDGQISASAGCNTMGGAVSFADGTMVVDSLSMTEMGCPGDGRHEQDQFVAAFLTAKPAYVYDGTTLKLNTADVTMAFGPREQVQPDLPLENTRWEVTHTTQGPAKDAADDPNAAVSAGMAPRNAFLEFAGGKVTGSDGCNSLFGDATISGDTITFGPIGTTKKACPDSDAPPAMRDTVLKVLSGEVEWSIDYNILHLENASGAGLQLSAAKNADDLPLKTGESDPANTPPCCKPEATGGPVSDGSSGVNPAEVESTAPNTGTGGGPAGY